MIDPRNLKNKIEILNFEGVVLAVYTHKETGRLFLANHTDNLGIVYFEVNNEDIVEYINSKITINEIYSKYNKPLVYTKKRGIKIYHTLSVKPSFTFGEKLYRQICDSGKNIKFEELYG